MLLNNEKVFYFHNLKIRYNKYFIIKLYLMMIIFSYLFKKKTIKIGIIGLSHGNNIGNNLLKYAMFIKLKELGFEPYIIGTHKKRTNISFINKTTNLKIIKKDFSEINKNDYDILMVNSDQTWRKGNYSIKKFYDIAFLHFAKDWRIPKFVYGASLGFDFWAFSKKDEKIAKECLKNFKSISVREKSSINLIRKHLGIESTFVLDPTLLINKRYYQNIIKNYREKKKFNDKCLLTYIFLKENITRNFIEKASHQLGYKIYNVKKHDQNSIEKFIYGIIKCKAVITNSFHGTIFSIIFNKPFVTFIFKNSPRERLISLINIFNIKNRIFEYDQIPDLNLLTTPLKLKKNLFNSIKIQSINFLKKNLDIFLK